MDEVAERNFFFKLPIHTVKNGQYIYNSQYIYKLRAQILSEIFRYPISVDVNTLIETNVDYLASILFKETVSKRHLSAILVVLSDVKSYLLFKLKTQKLINNTNINEIVTQNVYLEKECPCCTKHCTGFEKTTLSETGKCFKFSNLLLNIKQITLHWHALCLNHYKNNFYHFAT